MPSAITFNNNEKRWDTYKAFHWCPNDDMVHFETGELILTAVKRYPLQRGTNTHGVIRLYRHDKHQALDNLYTPDGMRVKRSWLAAQSYVYDTTTAQLFAVGYGSTQRAEQVPVHLARVAKAYCAGSGRKWVSASDTHVIKPVRLTREQKQALKEVKMVCDTQRRMGLLPAQLWHSEGKARFSIHRGNFAVPHKFGLSGTVDDLSPMERNLIAMYGFAKPTDEQLSYECLEVR